MSEPTKVSEISITMRYEVDCQECGVIDAPRSYKAAIKARRRHFERDHAETKANGGTA